MKKKRKLKKPSYLRVKILTVGEKRVGKSSIIKRFCEKRFRKSYVSTIGVDYGVKRIKVEDTEFRINFWDLSGEIDYFEIRNEFYTSAQGCLFIFDLSKPKTFNKIKTWLGEVKKYGGDEGLIKYLIGNKKDLNKREVSVETAKKFAEKNNFDRYYEVSAMNGDSINSMFLNFFKKILKVHSKNEIEIKKKVEKNNNKEEEEDVDEDEEDGNVNKISTDKSLHLDDKVDLGIDVNADIKLF